MGAMHIFKHLAQDLFKPISQCITVSNLYAQLSAYILSQQFQDIWIIYITLQTEAVERCRVNQHKMDTQNCW